MRKILLIILCLIFSVHVAHAQTLGPNLISNPSFEASTSPVGWAKGGYGTNSRVFNFPVTGSQGVRGARVAISSYTSGDAKWYFNYVPVKAGHTYQFSDDYISDGTNIVDVQFKMSDGSFTYKDIATLGSSSSYKHESSQFVVPSGAVSLTVFHLINRVGTLDTDNYSLNEVIPDNNLIPNGDFESGSSGAPTGWSKGTWGSNNAVFTYPASGVSGSRGASIEISSYASGDAKWFFSPLVLSGGTYTFSDSYLANVPTTITAQYQASDGSFTYKDVAFLPAVSSFTQAQVKFYVPTGTANVTLFHLINRVGTLTVDNANLVKNANPTGIFSTGAVSITFDDGWLSQYQNALPKLESSGLKATFYIVSKQMADFGFPGYMSQAQVKEVFADGHEIGAHTRTHPHLSTLSASAQQSEIIGSQSDLNNIGVGPVQTFAYPFGDYNSTTLSILRSSSLIAARSSNGGYVDPGDDPYQLTRQVVTNATTLAQMEDWINEARSSKQWLILEIHEVSTNNDELSITPTVFNELIDYLKTQNIKVVTVRQGVNDM